MVEELDQLQQEEQQQQQDPPSKKRILYDAISKKYDLGTYDEFDKKLQDKNKRKAFYEGVGAEYDLGSYDDFEMKIGVKKKGGGKTLPTTTSHTQSPSVPPYTEENNEIPTFTDVEVGEDPIALARKANELKSKRTTVEVPSGSSFGMGTGTTQEVPDDNAQFEYSQIKERLKKEGYDADKLAQDFSDIPDNTFNLKGFTKGELMDDYKNNPQLYERKVGTAKWQSNLLKELNKEGNGQVFANVKTSLDNISNPNIDYNTKRNNIQDIVRVINTHGGENKKEILRNLSVDLSNVYAEAAASSQIRKDNPLFDKLNSNQLAAYQLLEDTNPQEANRYKAALLDDKAIEGNFEAQLQKQEAGRRLDEMGIMMQKSYANEKLNPIIREYEPLLQKANDGTISPAEQARMQQLEEAGKKYKDILDSVAEDEKSLVERYPKASYLDANNFAQELIGQKHSGLDWMAMEMGKATDNTAKGLQDLVTAPFRSEQNNEINQAEVLGGSELSGNSAYLKQGNQTTQSFKPEIEPELQKQIDAIKDNDSLTKREKLSQVTDLLMENGGKWRRAPIEGGKTNIGLSSLMYGVGGLAANLAPFMALELGTGGGASATALRKFTSAFTSAAATGFHDSYVQALEKGSDNPFAEAARVTAINSAAMAGAGTPDAIRKMLGNKTAVGKLVSGMTDDAIELALKAEPKALSNFKKAYESVKNANKSIANTVGENLKTSSKLTAFTTGGQIANDAISGELKSPNDYAKQAAIETLKFTILGTAGGMLGKISKKPSSIQLASLHEAGRNPEAFMKALEAMEKDGSISPTDAQQVRTNVEKVAKIFKSSPIINKLNENQKREYIYNQLVKLEAKEAASNLPPKQAEKADMTAMVADKKNELILEPKNDEQLQKEKERLEKILEPKKDAEGKTIELPEQEKKQAEAELQAITEIQKENEQSKVTEDGEKGDLEYANANIEHNKKVDEIIGGLTQEGTLRDNQGGEYLVTITSQGVRVVNKMPDGTEGSDISYRKGKRITANTPFTNGFSFKPKEQSIPTQEVKMEQPTVSEKNKPIPKETAASTVPVDNNMEKVNRLIFDRETGQPLDGSDETMAEQLIEKAISKSKDTDQANAKLDQLGYNLRGQANADFNQFVQDRIDGKTDMTFSEWKNQSENKPIQNEPIKEALSTTVSSGAGSVGEVKAELPAQEKGSVGEDVVNNKTKQQLLDERLNKIKEIKDKAEGTREERTKRYKELANELGDETAALKKLQQEINDRAKSEIDKLPKLPKTENEIISEKGENDYEKIKKDLGFKPNDYKWGEGTPMDEDMGDMLLSKDKEAVIFIKPNEVEVYDEKNDQTDTVTNGVKIELVSTKESSRGKGKAKEMVKKVTDWADKNNTDIFLDIAPQDKNTTEIGLKKLYESFGFEFDGIHGKRKAIPAKEVKDNVVGDGVRELPAQEKGSVGEDKTGLVLYHGSPHSFENFDITKLGSGEGNQAFGHGLYFTNESDIAKGYANKLGSKKNFWESLQNGNQLSLSKEDFKFIKDELDALGFDGYEAEQSNLGDIIVDGKTEFAPEVLDAMAILFGKNAESALNDFGLSKPEISRLLEIKKKISDPQFYKVAVHEGKSPSEYDYMDWREKLTDSQIKKIGKDFSENATGEQVYKELSKELGSDKKASDYLLSKGIDGISYKSNKGTGGKTGEGRNYVIFDAKSIRIDEINQKKQPIPTKAETKVKKLRAEEQAEYDALPDPNDKVEKQKIYDKYDKLISPLLEEGDGVGEVPKQQTNHALRDVESTTKALVNESKEYEKNKSEALDKYSNPKNDAEEKEATRVINDIEQKRRERDKALFKDNKTDDKYDEVHDSILSDGDDMPNGYSATVIDSYYEPILGRNHTIAEVTNPKGEKYYIDVNTYKRRDIGETYGKLKSIISKGVGEVKVEVPETKEGFTEGKDLNKMFAGLKSKYGDKKGSALYEVANRLVNPNKNTIIEIRGNGVVVKENGKYILKPFGNTDANSKKWTLYEGIDISEQFSKAELPKQDEPTTKEAAKPVQQDAELPEQQGNKKTVQQGVNAVGQGNAETSPPVLKEGKYEAKARVIAEKIMATKVVPDWLKIDDENVSTKGTSAEDLKKVLADAVINMGKLLDRGVEFSQALRESVKGMIDIHGEGKRKEIEEGFEKYYRENEADVPPPKEPNKKEDDGSRKSRKLSLLKNLMGATKVPEHFKKGLEEKGLEYEVSNQAEAQQTARGIIDSIGREQALDAARDGLIDPSVGSAVFGEAINDMYSQEAKLRSEGKNSEADLIAQEWADTSYEYAKISNSGGKWNSQIAYFYKSSPMGIALRQKQQNAETFEEWFKGKEDKLKEVFEEIKKTEQGKSLIDEEVEKLRKEERKSERSKRRAKIEKFFDDAKFKGDAMYSTIIPPKIINAGLDVMKEIFLAGETAVNSVSKAIEIISKELGNDKWDKDKFRTEWEGKLRVMEGTSSQKSYEQLLKERGQELKRRIDEKDFSAEEYKEKKNLNDAEKAALEEFKKVKEAYDEEKKKSPEWKEKKAKQYLDNFRKRMEGMTDSQRKEVIRRSIRQLSESGALRYDDFKKIIAETIGIKEFTEEQIKKVEKYVEDINAEQDAEDAMVKLPSQENNRKYVIAREKAIQAQNNLYQLTNKQSDIVGTIKSWITGSLLSVPTLIKNVAQNVMFQSQLRFPTAVVRQLAELGAYGLSKALPGSRTFHPKTNLILAQKGYFSKGKMGIKRGAFLFNKGLQERDFNSRTVYQSTLSPKLAARELQLNKAGELYLTRTEKIDRYIRRMWVTRQADFILRAMGFGDNPQRWGAEGSTAIQIAVNELGIKKTDDVAIEAFMLSPEKYAYNHFVKEGKSTKEASELAKEIKKRIEYEGDKSVLQEENLLSKASELADRGLKSKKEDSPTSKAAKAGGAILKTLTFPFVKIPANAYWNTIKAVNPQLTLAYAVSQAAVAAKYRKEGNMAKANEYANKSSHNASLAVVGYGLSIAVSSLIANGLVRSSNDKEKPKKETEGERVFGKQFQINVGKMWGGDDYWVDLSWFGPVGTMIDIKARMHEDDMKAKLKGEEVDDSFLSEITDNATYSLSSGLNSLVFDQAAKTLDMFTNSRGSALDKAGSTFITNTVNNLGNMITGATFTAISKAALPEQAKLKADNVIDGVINNQKQRNLLFRTFAGMPKSRISIWGEPIKNDNSVTGVMAALLGFEKGSENKFGAIIYDDFRKTGDTRFFPNMEDNKISVQGKPAKLTADQEDELNIEIGKMRKAYIQAFVYDKSKYYDGRYYSQIEKDEDKVDALNDIYEMAKETGFKNFLLKHPEFNPSETEIELKKDKSKEKEFKSKYFKKQFD